jgi:UDP-3-O-[3-hydroxymyristoyl] glucosamine N-acyltransferase
MVETKAGVVIVRPDAERPSGRHYLIHEDPSAAFQIVLLLFQKSRSFSGFVGIHPTAVIHPKAVIGVNVTICPYAVVDEESVVGDRTFVGSHVYIGPRAKVGSDCVIHPHSVVREECVLRDRVILQPGAIIGSCGYGYTTDKKGEHHKLQHVGNVELSSDVEIGANTTIDRARFDTTRVGAGSKIDNLVQIGHNVEIGKGCLIVAQVGIAGSTKVGNFVILGGQVGVNGHITLTDGVRVTARSGVSKSLTVAGDYGGVVFPAQILSKSNRIAVLLRKADDLVQRVDRIEKVISTYTERRDVV